VGARACLRICRPAYLHA